MYTQSQTHRIVSSFLHEEIYEIKRVFLALRTFFFYKTRVKYNTKMCWNKVVGFELSC